MIIIVAMIEWEVRFDVRHPLPGFARPRRSATETVGAGYRIEGRRRRGEETHVLQLGLSGHGRFRDAEGERRIGPGDAFLCRVDDLALGYGHAGGAEPWRFAFLAFYGAEFEVAALRRGTGAVFHLGLEHPVVAQLAALRRYAGRSLEQGAAAVLVHGVLALLADPHGRRSAGARLIDRAREVADGDPPPGGVAELAARLGVTREHLGRVFRAELGINARDWLVEHQLQRACAALRGDDSDLATVAATTGFGSASHLCKVFRRVLGCTPSEYRRGRGMLL